MCSTPQKHPAATVAVCAPAGTVMGCAGADDMVLEVKGRKKRVKKDIDAYEKTISNATVRSFSLEVVKLPKFLWI